MNVTAAAEAAEVDRGMHYEWLKVDPTYPERFDAAREAAADRLEAAAYARAVEGVTDYVVSQGRLVMVEDPETGKQVPLVKRVYSDVLAQLLLKGHKPERYREQTRHEITGKDGRPVALDVVFDLDLGDAENEDVSVSS